MTIWSSGETSQMASERRSSSYSGPHSAATRSAVSPRPMTMRRLMRLTLARRLCLVQPQHPQDQPDGDEGGGPDRVLPIEPVVGGDAAPRQPEAAGHPRREAGQRQE